MGMLVDFLQKGLLVLNVAFGNWGLAIMGLTLILRLLLLPLQSLAYIEQKKLRLVQPDLDILKEKFKKDPMQFLKASSDLKKKNEVKSWLMFLTMLVQLPVFLAMY